MEESLPFENVGGSPTVIHVRMADGQVWELRIVVAVVEVAYNPDIANPQDPDKPLFRINPSPRSNVSAHLVEVLSRQDAAIVLFGEAAYSRSDPLIVDIFECAPTSGDGLSQALTIAGAVRRAPGHDDVEAFAFATEGGGLAIEFESSETGRELSFSVPDNGSVSYFVARGRGFRKAGAVVEVSGLSGLGQWLVEEGRSFPSRGIATR